MRNNSLLVAIFVLFFSNISAQSIHRIACRGALPQLDSLLQDTSIEVKDQLGRSLLHWAVACRQKEVFDYLVEKGIPINAVDNNQETPLHIAVQMNRVTYLDLLLDLQANQDWTAQLGPSLIEKAILRGHQALIKKLIDRGVDINARNERGSTPLEIAQRIGAHELSEWLIAMGADTSKVRKLVLQGAYMGQAAPGLKASIFAPNFISTEESEFGSVFNKAGTEFFYGVDVNGKNEIRFSELINNQWSTPKTIISHKKYGYNDPFLSPDENRLYFISKRAMDGEGELKDQDIWYVERTKDSWSEPINAGPNINSERNEYYISFTQDGTMYFSSNVNAPEGRVRDDYDVYYSKFVDGAFQKAIALDANVNTEAYEADVFVAPDESYLIFCGIRPEGLGRGDLYISFKESDGTWSKSINMGPQVNTIHHELCPYVSSDGKYLFFTSDQDIYWIDATIIDLLKEKKKE